MGVLNLDVERHLIEHEIISLGYWRKNGTSIYYLGNVKIDDIIINQLIDNSMVDALHRHSEVSAIGGVGNAVI